MNCCLSPVAHTQYHLYHLNGEGKYPTTNDENNVSYQERGNGEGEEWVRVMFILYTP